MRRTQNLLARRDDCDDEPPDALAHAQAESAQPSFRLRTPDAAVPPERGSRPLCALIDGFSLHAATVVDVGDRAAVERLVRYILRPAISAERVTLRPDGRVEYRFRHPDPTGRTSWVTDGVTLCRRLATLVPPAKRHAVVYHGVFSAAHKLRGRVVPTVAASPRHGEAVGSGVDAVIHARHLS